ncbi:MAG: META domain-containing protein [Treponema sp.]|nr:META domain-containing protein [Treponema sp.]
MKVNVKIVFAAALIAALAACGGSPAPARTAVGGSGGKKGVQFSDVMDRDWLLAELRLEKGVTVIDRSKPTEDGYGWIFSIRFDDERASGIGAVNRFRGAFYTLSEDQGISIGMIAQTMMASIYEQDNLDEFLYFGWLQDVKQWRLVDDKLELHATAEDGSQAVLLFTPAK